MYTILVKGFAFNKEIIIYSKNTYIVFIRYINFKIF